MYQVAPVFCWIRDRSCSPMSMFQPHDPAKKFTSLRLTTSGYCATIVFAVKFGSHTPLEFLVLWMFHCIRRSLVPVELDDVVVVVDEEPYVMTRLGRTAAFAARVE